MTESFETKFAAARRRYIASRFEQLNPMQREAVLTTEGPLLLLAGAGSGKTTVLIQRIANLISFGCGSDSPEVPLGVTQEDLEFLEHLRSKGDFWHHQNGLLAHLYHLFNEFEEYLGFSTSSNPVEQRYARTVGIVLMQQAI